MEKKRFFFGSQHDIKNHLDSIQTFKAVVIYDVGAGRIEGFSLGGRSDMLPLIEASLEPVKAFGPFTHTTDAFIGTDNFDYLLHGIPTLVANQETQNYLPFYHAESDTVDKVNPRELKLNTLISSILIWNLANTTVSFPPHIPQKRYCNF